VNWHHKAMPGVTITLLKLPEDVPREQIACDMGGPIENQSRLPCARCRALQSSMQGVHRPAIAILDPDVEAELVIWRWLQELRPHTLSRADRFEYPGLIDGSGRLPRWIRRAT